MRQTFLLFLIAIVLSSRLPAQQTAYQALKVAGKGRPATFLNGLITAEGLKGSPQPKIWRLIFDDPTTHGGVREIEVSGGEIVSERTPLKNPFPSTGHVALAKLQLDSDGAFTAAENEAIRRKIGFDQVNFLLRANDPAGNPVWRVQLLDAQDHPVSAFFIDARNGLLTGVEGREIDPTAGDPDSPEMKIHRTLVKTGETIKDGFKQVGGSIQEVFTGHRTIGQDTDGQ